MSASSSATADCANFGTEVGCGNRRRALRLNDRVMQKARAFSPVKTAPYLAGLTGYSTRAAESWLSGKVVLPTDALAALIQSDDGRDYLAAVMAEQTPRWWMLLQAYLKRISYEMQQALQAKQYREMLDEEAKLAGAYPSSPVLQDDPFYSAQPSPHRPLASKKRR